MYTALLAVHSYVRWAVLVLALVVVARAIGGLVTKRTWDGADDTSGRWFGITLDIQFLLGLILYVALSPFTREAFADFGAAMRDSGLRYWAVEHLAGMIVAVALVHVGRTRIRKTQDGARRHRLAAIFFGLALVAMLASIPWPGMPNGRPLFRGLAEY
jgi:hypothetical protein